MILRYLNRCYKSFASAFENRDGTVLAILLFGIAMFWLTSAVGLYYFHHLFPDYSGTLGDTMGIVNSFFSALAFAGVYYSLRQQRKTLQLQQYEINRQTKTQNLERFENTFFKLFDLHQAYTEKLEYYSSASIIKGRGALVNEYTEFRQKLRAMHKLRVGATPALDDQGFFALNFREYLKEHKGIEKYLEGLHDLHKYLVRHPNLLFAEKQFYLDIITRQMTEEELCYYFYYSIFIRFDRPDSSRPDIFVNLATAKLVKEEHLYWFYSQTNL